MTGGVRVPTSILRTRLKTVWNDYYGMVDDRP